jgi:hypothetical protein
MIKVTGRPPGLLEKFGLYYLGRFSIRQPHGHPFDQTDDELVLKVRKISKKGIFLSAIVGILTVFPIVWLDLHFTNAGFWTHYGILAAAIIGFTLIEFYLLFLISLKAVHEVSAIINMEARSKDYLDGLFGVKNILARTALELPDPELMILGIDPFQRISKKNLFVLSLIYKGKIILTNLILKLFLTLIAGPTLFGIPIAWEALLVEAFWNGVVIKRVVMEARLRLFGYALAEEITETVINEGTIFQLSPEARIGCLRSIGNAVVMTQNYHPNMIMLLLHFADTLRITEENEYDDWDLFLETLSKVPARERYFLLDLFTVAAAFDGKLSKLEQENLRSAYQEEYNLYLPRLQRLTHCLKGGRLNEAYGLCRLDYVAG